MTVDAVKNIEDLAQFVCDSPVSYLAARTVARRLQAAGFTELNETEPWQNEARSSLGLAVGGRRRRAVTGCWARIRIRRRLSSSRVRR